MTAFNSSASSSEMVRPPMKWARKEGSEPSKARSTTARLSSRSTASRGTAAVTTAFSLRRMPRSTSFFSTV